MRGPIVHHYVWEDAENKILRMTSSFFPFLEFFCVLPEYYPSEVFNAPLGVVVELILIG